MKERIYLNYAERWKLRFDKEHYERRRHRKSMALIALASLFVIIIFALPWIWQVKLDYDLKITEEKIESYNEVSLVLQDIDRLQASIASMEQFLQITEDNSKNPRAVLEMITELLPEGTEVNSFALQADNSVQLSMVLTGPPAVAQLWINLRDSGKFEHFDIKTVSLVDQAQNINLTLKIK